MKIKTKLHLTIIVTIVVFTSILFLSYSWHKEVDDLYERGELVKELLFNIFAKDQIKNEYFNYREDRSKEQWDLVYKKIEEYLAQMSRTFTSPDEKASTNRLISMHKDIGNRFNQLVKHDESLTDRGAISKELRERILSQMMAISHTQYSEVMEFQKDIVNKIEHQNEFINFYSNATFGLLAALIITFAVFLIRGITYPLARLHKGTEIIGSGNLDYKTEIRTKDEIGDLSAAFDRMLENLKTVTASRDELSKEIEKRMRAEAELRIEKEKAQNYLEVVSVMILSLDCEGKVMLINPAGCAMLGYQREEILGRNWFEHFLPAKVSGEAREIFGKMIAGDLYLFEYVENPVLTKSGGERIFAWHNSVLRNESGEVIGTLASGEDITERKQADEALRESEERYRLIFDHSPLGIMHFDSEGIIRDFNDKFEQIMGAPRERILGFNMLARLSDPAMLQAVKDSLEGKLGHYEGDYLSVTGEKTTPMRALYKRIETEDGTFRGAVALFEDITERRKMEEELLKSKKLETIGILAGGIAHDFNNILYVILGNIEMAQLDIDPATPSSDCLAVAEKAALQAKDLTTKFITFSAGGAPQKKFVPIRDLITDTVNLALTGSNVECKYLSQGDSSWSDQAEVDLDQMSQAIYNIVVNGREAMPGGGTIWISTGHVEVDSTSNENNLSMETGKYLKISIKDQGLGMPKEDLEKIFDPYFSTKQRGSQKGMGLGLAIAHSVVSKHAGYISVESEIGVGTSFNIFLPVSQEQQEAPAIE